MSSRLLFNIFVAIALLVVIGLTAREVAATTSLIDRAPSTGPLCSSLSSQPSLHTEYAPERGGWVIYTQDVPSGVEGGLIQLLSDYRNCSQ